MMCTGERQQQDQQEQRAVLEVDRWLDELSSTVAAVRQLAEQMRSESDARCNP